MICKKYGAEMKSDAGFCPQCGEVVKSNSSSIVRKCNDFSKWFIDSNEFEAKRKELLTRI